MANRVKVAGVQMEPKILEKARNLDRCIQFLREAANKGARLIVFPECALTGYCFSSLEEAMPGGEPIPGPSTEALAALCKELEVYAIVGLLERVGEELYNAAAVIGPRGVVGHYRKIHLPYLGVDRFVNPGDRPFRVYATDVGVLGTHICYDCSFPESTRVMALQGGEIIALPTNWPTGRENVPAYIVNARALENRVHFIAVNRVGRERGFEFIGRSKIVDTTGTTLAEASSTAEETIYAEVDLGDARRKRIVIKPGEFELDFFEDRRPRFYESLVEDVEVVSGRKA